VSYCAMLLSCVLLNYFSLSLFLLTPFTPSVLLSCLLLNFSFLSLPPYPLHFLYPSLIPASPLLLSLFLTPSLPLSFSHFCFSITPLSLFLAPSLPLFFSHSCFSIIHLSLSLFLLTPSLPLSFSHFCFSITHSSSPHPFTPSVLLSFLLLHYSSLSLFLLTPSVLLSFLLLHYSSLYLSSSSPLHSLSHFYFSITLWLNFLLDHITPCLI